tara:strand:+ start:2038 stop:2337 length:300 start_codon:yes stop_codon:yes gene_type:complete
MEYYIWKGYVGIGTYKLPDREGKLINIEYDDMPIGYVWLGVDYHEDCDEPIFSWNMKNDGGTDWSRSGQCKEEANNLILEYNEVFKIVDNRNRIIDRLI